MSAALEPVVVGDDARSAALAHALGVALRAEVPGGDILWLRYGETGLALGGDPSRFGQPLCAELVGGRVGHRRRFGGGRGQLLARACGLGKGVTPEIVDATAGLGRDAATLAALGARVLLIERQPAIAALLADALARLAAEPELSELRQRLSLVPGDSSRELAALVAESGVLPQVVHLDPMYPHRQGSALVKKEMRLFRALAGDDEDAPALLEQALAVATHRVVVKRPKGAPPIEGPAPHHQLSSKNSRYDLYVHRSLKAL
ncbi:class I SAM-dependent methyltransferase [Kushneria aurantia]|uniref:Ribosomal RNA small subunit methyltransferase J n=1 Tax=Kushneria aurantia TaxID=504092 RepID=A0ABV6G2E7_9GAMM|nr:class I SAM-dependent methyltransferase [Kushneria aurantia]